MILRSSFWILLVSVLVALAPACAKKKSDSGGGGSTKRDDADDTDDDETLEGDDTDTDTDACLIDDCSEGSEGLDPDSEFYEQIFTPPELTDCNEGGHVYLRCTRTCSDIGYPAKFKCDRAGIEQQFANVGGFKEDFQEYVDAKKYFIDQCGVTAANKPVVVLSCFTKGDGECADKDDIDTETAEVLSHVISTDASMANVCDGGLAP
jgi:hypothetical protein